MGEFWEDFKINHTSGIPKSIDQHFGVNHPKIQKIPDMWLYPGLLKNLDREFKEQILLVV